MTEKCQKGAALYELVEEEYPKTLLARNPDLEGAVDGILKRLEEPNGWSESVSVEEARDAITCYLRRSLPLAPWCVVVSFDGDGNPARSPSAQVESWKAVKKAAAEVMVNHREVQGHESWRKLARTVDPDESVRWYLIT